MKGTAEPTVTTRIVFITTIPLTQWLFQDGQNAFLQANGFEIHAVASPGELLDKLAERDKIVTYPIQISRRISPLQDIIALRSIYSVLRAVQPDMVHVSTPKAALIGALAAKLAGVPLRVYFIRGLATEAEVGWHRRLYQLLERLTAALCTHSVAVSPSLLAYARTCKILGRTDGAVPGLGMSNGVDTNRFKPGVPSRESCPALSENAFTDLISGETAVLGFVGRLTRDKGVGEISSAWRRLREAHPRLRLLLVGPWEQYNPIEKQVRAELEADPRVYLTGQVADVAPYYQLMKLFLFPSHGTEGFPNAPMEAAATGLPVIASDVVGCVDAVADRVTGRVIPPRDAAALQGVVEEYLADPRQFEEHGFAARDRVVKSYSREIVWQGILAEYSRILHEPAHLNTDNPSEPPRE